MMFQSVRSCFTAAMVMASAMPLLAGGFYLTLGNPEASAAARAKNAVVTVRAAGCHEPEKAEIKGTAFGVVNGRRQTVDLKLMVLDKTGFYAVTQQWPSEGKWVLQFVGRDNGRVTTTLVPVGPDGVERQQAKWVMHEPAPEDVTALLNKTAAQVRQ